MLPTDVCRRMPIIDFCRMYEENIQKAGGLDYILLGVGHASNIMFNGVGSTLSSRTRLVLLEGAAHKEASRTFPSLDNVPRVLSQWGSLP